MNRFQTGRQVQYILRQLVWTDNEVVFPAPCVLVTMGLHNEVLQVNRLPLALIRPGAASVDPLMAGERPELVRIEFAVGVVVANAGDKYGETTLVGANRTGGSRGRGLLEVEEKMLAALFQLGPAAGLPIIFRGASEARPSYDENLGYVAACDYTFEAAGTLARTYAAPQGLARTGTTTAILAWNLPTRYDFRRFILRFAAGATPPATAAAGTGITLGGTPDGSGSPPPTGVTHSPGAGTYSYSLFAVYDDKDPASLATGSDVATSSPQTLASVVVS